MAETVDGMLRRGESSSGSRSNAHPVGARRSSLVASPKAKGFFCNASSCRRSKRSRARLAFSRSAFADSTHEARCGEGGGPARRGELNGAGGGYLRGEAAPFDGAPTAEPTLLLARGEERSGRWS